MSKGLKETPGLENLLRLKRAEVPSSEFWTRFERELREKQLAAIVEKRPWWCAFPRSYVLFLRHRGQIGSVAALSCAFLVSFHEYHAYYVPAAAPAAPASQIAHAPAFVQPASFAVAVAAERPAVAVMVVANHASAPESTVVAVSDRPATTDFASGPEASLSLQPSMSSARLVADNLAALRAHRSGIGGLSDFSSGFEPQAVSASAQMEEPLAQMSAASEERRSRFMASALPANVSSGDIPVKVSDRLVSRLSDDRLYESVNRYNVEVNDVSIKF
jgi:hypothetical protein